MKIIIKESTSKILFNESESSSDDDNDKCCLICSILPSLSFVNTCSKHLKLLTKSKKVIYNSNSRINSRSKFKYPNRFSSSSSSSTEHRRKRRTMILKSSDSSSQDDLFFTPNGKSQKVMKPTRMKDTSDKSTPSEVPEISNGSNSFGIVPQSLNPSVNVNKNCNKKASIIDINESNNNTFIDEYVQPRIILKRVHCED